MNLKICLFLVFCNSILVSSIFGQALKINLSAKSDTLVNSFTVFTTGKTDTKSNIKWNASKFKNSLFTTTRSIYFKSIDEILGVLIGENAQAQKFIVFDKNMNRDFADNAVIYFHDTINSSNKGNYKTFVTAVKNTNGQTSTVTFDYTIIKPRALNLDLGDNLENKFFFAYRNRDFYSTQAVVG